MASDDEETRITLRLPSGIRNRLAVEASRHGRSINSEIVARLEKSFEQDDDVYNLANQVEEMATKLDVLWDVYRGRDPYNPDK